MAEKLNLSETGYAKIERGETKLTLERVQQIAKILAVNWVELLPFGDDGVLIFNNSNDNFSNSSNFSLAFGQSALESDIINLRNLLETKNEIISSKENEIEVLKQQIKTLESLVSILQEKSE